MALEIERADVLEKVVVHGDLSKLTPEERLTYYRLVCESLGLNPLTRPFDYVVLNGRLTLYANRSAADQLRKIHGISVEVVDQRQVGDLYIVHVRARDREGRTDEDMGVVSVAGLKGDALANALLKAMTKAKRRVTLSLAGLGWLDETEVEAIPEAQTVEAQAVEKREPEARPGAAIETGRRRLESMRQLAQRGLPFEEQMAYLVHEGMLGTYLAERWERDELQEDELVAALAALPQEKAERFQRWATERLRERKGGSR